MQREPARNHCNVRARAIRDASRNRQEVPESESIASAVDGMQTAGTRRHPKRRDIQGVPMASTNHVAVVVAAIAFVVLGAAWYTVLAVRWAAGIGKTMEQLRMESGGSFMPMVIGFIAILVMCYTLSSLLNGPGDTTTASGAKVGAFVALGFVAASTALHYGFEMRGVSLWTIDSGYVLVRLTVAGAIIGGCRKKFWSAR